MCLKPIAPRYQETPKPTQWTERRRVGLPVKLRKKESGSSLEVSGSLAAGKVSTRHLPGRQTSKEMETQTLLRCRLADLWTLGGIVRKDPWSCIGLWGERWASNLREWIWVVETLVGSLALDTPPTSRNHILGKLSVTVQSMQT